MRRILRPSDKRRLAELAATRAAALERAAERAIDLAVEQEAAESYWRMIGANLPLDDRRRRAAANNPLRPHVHH